MNTIIYLHPQPFFFVRKDIDALHDRGVHVFDHSFNSGPSWWLPWDLLRQAIFLFKARQKSARTVICHFAGWHSVLPVLFGFRTFIIVAGSDSCSFPLIDYGSFRKRGMRWAMSISMRNAERILPVHASLERFSNSYSDAGPKAQGYAHFIRDLRTPSTAIPYGFDHELWDPPSDQRDLRSVLTIATAASFGNAIHFRKGIDLLIEAAKSLPQIKFTVIGTDRDSYRRMPSNMEFHGTVPPEELRLHFARHSIYAQPSIMEGFPNALCEAMLMGCIPIASAMTSMPEIVGDAGAIIAERDPAFLIKTIEMFISMDEDELRIRRERSRDRMKHYTMDARVERLLQVIGHDQRDRNLSKDR